MPRRTTHGVEFQLTCNLYRESLKTQVWLCFLILSFSTTSTCAVLRRDRTHLQDCVDWLKPSIEKSDAMLYAPSADDVEGKCKIMSLKCYMLELIMVIDEEELWENTKTGCILEFNDKLPPEDEYVGCPPCEAYTLRNITIFLDRLSNLLQEMNAAENV
ncbi:interleukin-15-like isoform X2 [Cheilinus undulatus]|uniref:interleukin-15-like isoform X2 n=1 Tax=Cheilinus undulatus TaxID=241271 RepID=UPI001BD52B13|nr:interleukin-15-like isoform X2 [Cheilinus undulatus]